MSNGYKILTGRIARFENGKHVIYKAGDVVRDLGAAEVARFAAKGMIEATSVAVPVVEEGSAASGEPLDDSKSVLDGHWRTVVKVVEDLDEAASVEDLLAQEEARESPRRAVVKALTKRLAELE